MLSVGKALLSLTLRACERSSHSINEFHKHKRRSTCRFYSKKKNCLLFCMVIDLLLAYKKFVRKNYAVFINLFVEAVQDPKVDRSRSCPYLDTINR